MESLLADLNSTEIPFRELFVNVLWKYVHDDENKIDVLDENSEPR